jgi:hypothetical protein
MLKTISNIFHSATENSIMCVIFLIIVIFFHHFLVTSEELNPLAFPPRGYNEVGLYLIDKMFS